MHTADKIVAIAQSRAGKDKTIKIIQYTGRLLIRYSESQPKQSLLRAVVAPRVAPLVKEFSAFRKVIKFGDWLKTLRSMINSPHPPQLIDFIDLYNEIMDDLYFLAKIGVLDSKQTRFFERQGELAWFAAILLNINEKRGGSGKIWRLDMAKLTMDFVFCYVDVFRPNWDSSVQTVTGLMSAILAYWKLWLKA